MTVVLLSMLLQMKYVCPIVILDLTRKFSLDVFGLTLVRKCNAPARLSASINVIL